MIGGMSGTASYSTGGGRRGYCERSLVMYGST